MRARVLSTLVLIVLVTLSWISSANALAMAAPQMTLTATNVSLSGQGSGASNFTLTSVGGFSGQVIVTCTGPDPNLLPNLILPNCTNPYTNIALPANGTVTGSMPFTPPASITSTAKLNSQPAHPGKLPLRLPLRAGAVAAIGLIGLRLRGMRNRLSTLILLMAGGLAALAGVTGCTGRGGLEMTPGTYAYVIQATPKSGGAAVSTTISVTVHRN